MTDVAITVCRDELTGSLQLEVGDDRGGFRLAGPKFSGNSIVLLRAPLDERARKEVRRYLDKVDRGDR